MPFKTPPELLISCEFFASFRFIYDDSYPALFPEAFGSSFQFRSAAGAAGRFDRDAGKTEGAVLLRGSLFLFLPEPIDVLNQNKDGKGDDEEVDDRVDEQAEV